jgi:hypothetical protein
MHNACFTDNILTTKMKKENKTATYPSETKKKNHYNQQYIMPRRKTFPKELYTNKKNTEK